VTVYLVRHAKAGDRHVWEGNDEDRPLSGRGRIQSRGLVPLLADATFDRLLSSPYVRCMETLIPLAAQRGLAIEPVEALAEGGGLDDAVALVRKHVEHGAVLCTHGDIIPMLLSYYADRGVDIGKSPQWPKGSTWILETDATNEVVVASYVPPPPG
jgi:8-oxo-dGTP diphosphatase